MQESTRVEIKRKIEEVMDRVVNRRISLIDEEMKNILETNPFGARLVPEQIWKGSKFERSFVTSLGQGVFEQIALLVAEDSGAVESSTQYTQEIELNTWQMEKIENILADQRENRSEGIPVWEEELKEVKGLKTKTKVTSKILFDLYIKREDGTKEYYSLKTVKPNLDQTERAKRDMLRICTFDKNAKAYLALPYNPFGEKNTYKWTMPFKMFDMNNAESVLIGSDMWNTIGNDKNTFNELLNIFDEVGKKYKKMINDQYLK